MQQGYRRRKGKLLSRQGHLQIAVWLLSPPRFFFFQEKQRFLIDTGNQILKKKTEQVLQDELRNRFFKISIFGHRNVSMFADAQGRVQEKNSVRVKNMKQTG